ncbi:MAG: NHLP bacteriocin export ABC transporter permease/ATPase subunit, partial [Chloroflexales bacterium]
SSDSQSHLLAACALVGAAVGIVVQPHAHLTADGDLHDELAGIATASRFRTRQVILKGEWWRQDNGPLLAHRTEDKQPVALLPRGPRRYAMVDPATGTRTPVTPEVAGALASLAFQIYRPLPEGPLSSWDLLRFSLFGGRRDLWTLAASGLATGLLALVTPLATGYLLSRVVPSGAPGQVLLLGLALTGGALGGATFGLTQNLSMLRLSSRANAGLQAAVWDRLISLPLAFTRAYNTGDLGDRAMSISAICQTLGEAAITAVLSVSFALFSLGLLLYYDPTLGLTALGLVAIFGAVVTSAAWLRIRWQRELSDLRGRLVGLVLQLIIAIPKLRVAAAEARGFGRWATQFQAQKRANYQARVIDNAMTAWNAAFPTLALLVIFGMAGTGGMSRLAPGVLLGFLAALGQLLVATQTLSGTVAQVMSVVPLYERVRPILRAQPEAQTAGHHPGRLTGAIQVEGVCFRYRPDGPLILDNLSLEIAAGESIALVGPSGSGKSTLLRLLLGFERPDAGAIRYDGQNLVELDVSEVRRQLGVVLQNTGLITHDIFHNIIGSAALSVEEAWAAARQVGLAEEIEQMPMGMYTLVPEGGSTFSGGQRQRLLLARALVRRPCILFLDEATSALDNVTQAMVISSLARLQATRVIVAHRMSTIRQVDRICVLSGGKLVESGTYAELLARDGVFADLARRQL